MNAEESKLDTTSAATFEYSGNEFSRKADTIIRLLADHLDSLPCQKLHTSENAIAAAAAMAMMMN